MSTVHGPRTGHQGSHFDQWPRNYLGTARKIVDAGGSLRDVRELAGHRSLQTTQFYTRPVVGREAEGRDANVMTDCKRAWGRD